MLYNVAATDACVLGSEFEMEAFAKFLNRQLATLPAQHTKEPKPKSSSKTCIVLLVVVVWCLLFMLLINNDEL